jgi:hypothetical protein
MIITAEEAKTKWCPFARVRPAIRWLIKAEFWPPKAMALHAR